MTYSIVVRHPSTGQVGVAAQSHYLAVGSVVGWARAGIGVVATQAQVLPSYGPLGLDALAAGQPPSEVLESLRAADERQSVRQVAILSAAGDVAAFTGHDCMDHASDVTGAGFSAQGNMLRARGIPDAMAEAWEAAIADGAGITAGMLAALDAAESLGGDIRGRQSATILVVGADADPGAAAEVDMRVDDHRAPLAELRRLVELREAYQREGQAIEAVSDGRIDDAMALAETWRKPLGDNPELDFWLGRALRAAGADREAGRLLDGAAEIDPGWAALSAWLDAHPRSE